MIMEQHDNVGSRSIILALLTFSKESVDLQKTAKSMK